jgi:hypothetical protein
MPRLPMPPTDSNIYDKNVKEQQAALGRFVEEFELMIHEIREVCIEQLCNGLGSKEREHLIEIAFHHQAMTAKPLYDIMRAIIAEIVGNRSSFHFAKREQFKSLLGHIENEVTRLYSKRNELLHGTWFIGFVSRDDPHAEKFKIQKFKTSADGLISAKELPKSTPELSKLADRCDDARTWIGHVDWCIRNEESLSDYFKREEKTWFFRRVLQGEWTTLPRT